MVDEEPESCVCEICKQEIKPEELQVWLQTKHFEFDDWRYLEDFKFHNSCWVNKMRSIRERGQNDALTAVTKGLKGVIGNFKEDGGMLVSA